MLARLWIISSSTTTPADFDSSRNSAIESSASARGPVETLTKIALSAPEAWRATRRLRAISLSSASINARKSTSNRDGATGSRNSNCFAWPFVLNSAALDGSKCAERTTPGNPVASSTSIAAIKSNRSNARSVKSSRVSSSPRRCVCTQRSPRKRSPATRTRLKSGISIRRASPTITYST